MAQRNDFDLGDPFDSRGYQKELGALIEDLRTKQGPEVAEALFRYAPQVGDLTPVVTRTYARELRHHWRTFCEGAIQKRRFPVIDDIRMVRRYLTARRSDEAHAVLEHGRALRIGLILEEMEAKYSDALRTIAMLERSETDGAPFVLLLRGFHFGHVLELVMIDEDHMREVAIRVGLTEALGPVPLAFIGEPAESIAMGRLAGGARGYRVTAGEDWQRIVALLLQRASAIALLASKPSESIFAECALITEADRWSDTVVIGDTVEVDSRATRLAEGATVEALAAALKARIAEGSAPRREADGRIVPCAALWLTGEARQSAAQNVDRLIGFMDAMATRRVRTHLQVMLDTHYAVLGNALMLERLDLVLHQIHVIGGTYERFANVVEAAPRKLTDALLSLSSNHDRFASILDPRSYQFADAADAQGLLEANLTVFRALGAQSDPETAPRAHPEMGRDAADMRQESITQDGGGLANIRRHFDAVGGARPTEPPPDAPLPG